MFDVYLFSQAFHIPLLLLLKKGLSAYEAKPRPYGKSLKSYDRGGLYALPEHRCPDLLISGSFLI